MILKIGFVWNGINKMPCLTNIVIRVIEVFIFQNNADNML